MCLENLTDAYALLARDLNAAPEDFVKEENIMTVSALREGRRQYQSGPYFFHMASFGGNAVMTADERLLPFLRDWAREPKGIWLFELPNLLPLERELNRFGYTLTQSHHLFLSREETFPRSDVPVKWYFGREEIEPFYGDPRFPNALCAEYLKERPDTAAVCAMDGETVMGMAGCSEDAPGWEQIGIDVLPGYRSRGVGTYLTALLKNEVLRHGKIPFYGTGLSNIRSQRIALSCGFRPAWIEIGSKKMNENCMKNV